MDNYVNLVEVGRKDGMWTVKGWYNTGPDSILYTSRRLKRDAVNVALGIIAVYTPGALQQHRTLELIIKKRNGQIQTKNSYGNDPVEIPG